MIGTSLRETDGPNGFPVMGDPSIWYPTLVLELL
jgi:hypothetical protein